MFGLGRSSFYGLGGSKKKLGPIQRRLLAVFKQYPDARVGFYTTEIVAARLAGGGGDPIYLKYTIADPIDDTDARAQEAGVDTGITRGEVDDFYEEGVPIYDDRAATLLKEAWLSYITEGQAYGKPYYRQREEGGTVDFTDRDQEALVKMVPWIAAQVNKEIKKAKKEQREATGVDSPMARFSGNLGPVEDWVSAENIDLGKRSFQEADAGQSEWHERIRIEAEQKAIVLRQAAQRGDLESGEVVQRFEEGWPTEQNPGHKIASEHWQKTGGWSFQDLTERDQVEVEGIYLEHCVRPSAGSGYWQDVKRGRSKIMSIRDELNRPLFTFELHVKSEGERIPPRVQQIKGYYNRVPNTLQECDMVDAALDAIGNDYSQRASIDDYQKCIGVREREAVDRSVRQGLKAATIPQYPPGAAVPRPRTRAEVDIRRAEPFDDDGGYGYEDDEDAWD